MALVVLQIHRNHSIVAPMKNGLIYSDRVSSIPRICLFPWIVPFCFYPLIFLLTRGERGCTAIKTKYNGSIEAWKSSASSFPSFPICAHLSSRLTSKLVVIGFNEHSFPASRCRYTESRARLAPCSFDCEILEHALLATLFCLIRCN